MKDTSINIAEIFGDCVQGEGVTAGVPAVFIRAAGCNLACGGHNASLVGKEGADGELCTWWCDSEPVWRKGRKWTFDEVYGYLTEIGELKNIMTGTTHIVFTGGEPLLQANARAFRKLMEFMIIKWRASLPVNASWSTPYVEIETNGTVYNDEARKLIQRPYVRQINCSPKLANSGEPLHKRVVPDALDLIRSISNKNYWWKFVVSEKADWDRIMEDYAYLFKDCKRQESLNILLMPAGSTSEELNRTAKLVWQMAVDNNVRYTDRLQVRVWEMATGK